MRILTTLLLSCLLLTGCATPASKINGVQLGMSKADVIKIMGQPSSITADQEAEYLNYALTETPALFSSAYVATPYAVKLQGGKVVAYGRSGGPSGGTQPVVMPVVVR